MASMTQAHESQENRATVVLRDKRRPALESVTGSASTTNKDGIKVWETSRRQKCGLQ